MFTICLHGHTTLGLVAIIAFYILYRTKSRFTFRSVVSLMVLLFSCTSSTIAFMLQSISSLYNCLWNARTTGSRRAVGTWETPLGTDSGSLNTRHQAHHSPSLSSVFLAQH